jgi:hypothetical protein
VILEGVYALHPDIRPCLDLWIAVVQLSHSLLPSSSAKVGHDFMFSGSH